MRKGHQGRRDSNHKSIVNLFRNFPGVTVADTAALGNGFPDIVVGFRNKSYLIEIKDGNKKLTPEENEFVNSWCGDYTIIRNEQQVINFLQNISRIE
jgi:hypothetical protein